MKVFDFYEQYQIDYYSITALEEFFNKNNIKVKNLIKLDGFKYQFEVHIFTRLKNKNLFKDLKRTRQSVLKVLHQKILIFFFVISTSFFFYLQTLIGGIIINGTSNNLNLYIKNMLKENDIVLYHKLPSLDKLLSLEEQIISTNNDLFESIEIRKKGVYILVNYVKKREEHQIPTRNGKMYAKKDGVIQRFEIESGELKVKINDYVITGTLLVDDYVTNGDIQKYVGTSGKVYAYTYTDIEVSTRYTLEDSKIDVFNKLLLKAREQVSSVFIDDEIIDKELVEQVDYSIYKASMKVHYTLLENIVTYTLFNEIQ